MPPYNTIEGRKLPALFDQLISRKTLVKISMAKNAFESLTVVTDVRTEGSNSVFHMAPPKGFMGALEQARVKHVQFEFTSDDHVIHRFDAELKDVSADNVSLYFPELVHRQQKRDNFRVKVLHNSFATVSVNDVEVRMPIDNLSIGGVFCLCPNKHKANFLPEQMLENMKLRITLEKECIVIGIDQVQVNRFEGRPMPKHFGLAFEFMRIKRNDKKVLVQQIYELQRHFLKNRLKYLG